MTVGRTVRALPTILRVGVAETVAYRAEFLVWMLTTTLPLIMLGLWTSVAREAPFDGYGTREFTAYFLAALVVRNLTGSWVVWQLSEEIRTGALGKRLLVPVHPFVVLGATHLAAVPLRAAVALPFTLLLLLGSAGELVVRTPLGLAILAASLTGAWLLTFAVMVLIGALALFIDKAMAVMDVYLGVYALLSGYLVPLDLLPPWVEAASRALPFRYMLGFPVEVICSGADTRALLGDLAVQWAFVGLAGLAALAVWRAGLRRHQAFGG